MITCTGFNKASQFSIIIITIAIIDYIVIKRLYKGVGIHHWGAVDEMT